ncbi:hypothetical protein Tco_1184011 [Tanacetum coccineum]
MVILIWNTLSSFSYYVSLTSTNINAGALKVGRMIEYLSEVGEDASLKAATSSGVAHVETLFVIFFDEGIQFLVLHKELFIVGHNDENPESKDEKIGKMAPTKEKGRKLREHIDDTSIKLGHAEKFLKEHSDDENEEGTSISEAKTSSNGDIPRHAFDMVSIDAFKTGKKHPDVRYVLSSVIASICMFVRLLMSDDAAIVMLPVWESGLLADIMEESKCVLILWKLAFSDQNGSWHRVSKSPPEQVGGAVGYAASKYVQTDRLTAKSDLWTSGAVLE